MTLDRGFVAFPELAGVVTDPHFAERDRMGRLLAFVAPLQQDGWSDPTLGVGIDEATAVVVGPGGDAAVVARARCTSCTARASPRCASPVSPSKYAASYRKLSAGDTLKPVPSGACAAPSAPLVASGGELARSPVPDDRTAPPREGGNRRDAWTC